MLQAAAQKEEAVQNRQAASVGSRAQEQQVQEGGPRPSAGMFDLFLLSSLANSEKCFIALQVPVPVKVYKHVVHHPRPVKIYRPMPQPI